MAVTTEIAWGDGTSDKIYLTRNASEGNQTVLVSSDANTGVARSKVVTFSAPGASPVTLTVSQAGGKAYDAQIEYLQSDGQAWIDLGFVATQAIAFTLEINRSANTIRWDCGSEIDYSNRIVRLLIQEGNNDANWRYGNGGSAVTRSSNLVGDLSLQVNGRYVTIINRSTSNTYSRTLNAATFTTPSNFVLFGVNMGNGVPSVAAACSGVRFKNGVITDNGVSLDLIAVRVGQVGYLYDKNSGTLFGNQGGGAFILGNDIQ